MVVRLLGRVNRIRSPVSNKIVDLTLSAAHLHKPIACFGKMLCFYTGNGFGRTGFGYAVAEDSGGSQARANA